MSEAIFAVSEDQGIRGTLVRLINAAGFTSADSTVSPAAILLGCGRRIARNDLSVARSASRNGHRIAIILVTSRGSEELAIEAWRAGINNYLRLPLTPQQLVQPIEAVAADASASACSDRIIGVSKAIQDVKEYLCRAASCSSNILITGETGTGKELAANFIHRRSNRAEKPLIAINCDAIPDSLLESALRDYDRRFCSPNEDE